MLKNFYGMRTIKTGIAVSLSLLIAQLLGYTNPIFIVIAAIFSMNKTVTSSLKSGIARLTGTGFGAFMGLMFVLVFDNPNFLIIGLGVIIVIGFCNTLHIQNAIFLSCVVFCTINLDIITELSPTIYSLNRFFDTFLGIAIALFVNLIFRPYNNTTVIHGTIKDIQTVISSSLNTLLVLKTPVNLYSLQSKINFLKEEISAYESEFFRKNRHYEEICVLTACKQLLGNILIEMTSLSALPVAYDISIHNLELLDTLFPNINFENQNKSHTEEYTIYNFHLKKMLSAYQYLTEYVELVKHSVKK